MAEVNLVPLVFRVGTSLAVIHLCRTRRLEHARHVECERTRELASLGLCPHSLFLARCSIHRRVAVLVDVEAVQAAYPAVSLVDVVLLLEFLVNHKQVVYVVAAQDEASFVGRNVQSVQFCLHADQIGRAEAQTAGGGVALARGYQHRSLLCICRRAQRMGGLGELGVVYCVGMALFHTAHLVVAYGIELVVRYGCYLRLELVELYGYVGILKCLQGYGVGSVVYQHLGIDTHVNQVDDVVVYQRGTVGHTVQPRAGKQSAQGLH